MRFLITFLCMGTVVMVAAAVVVIEMFMKLLPLLIAALLVVVVVRYRERRRRPGPAAVVAAAAVANVPGAAAIVAPNPGALNTMPDHLTTPAYRQADVCASGLADGWVMVPVWRGPAPDRQQHTVIDAEVISEDDYRG
jgi:hypothetical protein